MESTPTGKVEQNTTPCDGKSVEQKKNIHQSHPFVTPRFVTPRCVGSTVSHPPCHDTQSLCRKEMSAVGISHPFFMTPLCVITPPYYTGGINYQTTYRILHPCDNFRVSQKVITRVSYLKSLTVEASNCLLLWNLAAAVAD